MGKWSNELAILVVAPGAPVGFDVAENTITGPPQAKVNESVLIKGKVKFNKPADAAYDLYIDVYVTYPNGVRKKVKEGLLVATISPGTTEKEYSFSIALSEKGSHVVQTFAYVAPHGLVP